MPVYDYAKRTYISQLTINTKKSCTYWNRYRGIILIALAPLVTGPELAAIASGFAAIQTACDILSRVPDPPPE